MHMNPKKNYQKPVISIIRLETEGALLADSGGLTPNANKSPKDLGVSETSFFSRQNFLQNKEN